MDHLWLPCFKSNRLSMTCRSTRDAYLSIPHTPLYDFIKNDFIQEGDGQVASGSASLPDPVSLETEEQRLEREQNEHDVLEALGDYKCATDAGILYCQTSRRSSKTKGQPSGCADSLVPGMQARIDHIINNIEMPTISIKSH